jgi:superoxide reductase
LFQSADWKNEKHSPVIELEQAPAADKPAVVTVSVGKQITHPNTSEHHISWIDLYFKPDGDKFPFHLGKYEFSAHGASAAGPNTSTVYSEPLVRVSFKTQKSGVLFATSYCNIHGLWRSEETITLS